MKKSLSKYNTEFSKALQKTSKRKQKFSLYPIIKSKKEQNITIPLEVYMVSKFLEH